MTIQYPAFHYQIINYHHFIHYPMSIIHYPLSIVNCQLLCGIISLTASSHVDNLFPVFI
jgi:hypothetical protein